MFGSFVEYYGSGPFNFDTVHRSTLHSYVAQAKKQAEMPAIDRGTSSHTNYTDNPWERCTYACFTKRLSKGYKKNWLLQWHHCREDKMTVFTPSCPSSLFSQTHAVSCWWWYPCAGGCWCQLAGARAECLLRWVSFFHGAQCCRSLPSIKSAMGSPSYIPMVTLITFSFDLSPSSPSIC